MRAASAARTPRESQTVFGLPPSTEQIAALISLAALSIAWVRGLAGVVR